MCRVGDITTHVTISQAPFKLTSTCTSMLDFRACLTLSRTSKMLDGFKLKVGCFNFSKLLNFFENQVFCEKF